MNLVRQFIFFLCVLVIVLLSNKAISNRNDIMGIKNLDNNTSVLVIGLLATLLITFALNLTGACGPTIIDNYEKTDCENNYQNLGGRDNSALWNNQASLCRGGAYMFQGNSPQAKMCQALNSTKEGRAMINAYNCPRGFKGMALNQFEYSSASNSNWQSPCEVDPSLEKPVSTISNSNTDSGVE